MGKHLKQALAFCVHPPVPDKEQVLETYSVWGRDSDLQESRLETQMEHSTRMVWIVYLGTIKKMTWGWVTENIRTEFRQIRIRTLRRNKR